MDANVHPIPVTILTGFLGAGKTTLLNKLTQSRSGKKFAIIENEFGEIPIDNELVVSAEDGLFELSNGCVCCTLNDELGITLNRLLTSGKAFDHLLIETTGIAEPAGVLTPFLTDPHLQERFRIDGIICLVDALHIEDTLETEQEAAKQIAFADLLLITKGDEVAPDYLTTLTETLRPINPWAAVHPAINGQVEGVDPLSLRAYDPDRVQTLAADIHDHSHHHHHHDEVVSHSFVLDPALDISKFSHWMSVLVMIQQGMVYRVKGILNIQGEENRIVLQSVRGRFALTSGDPWQPDEKRETRIVFIGRHLLREPLEKNLQKVTAK